MHPSSILTPLLLALLAFRAEAQVSLSAHDPDGQSSFAAAGRWSDGLAPSAGKDYVANGTYLRTPTTAPLPHIFAGRSLTIRNGGALVLKGNASGVTHIADLRFDNGYLSHYGSNGSTATLSGSLTVGSGGAYIYAGNGSLWLNSAIALNGRAHVRGSSEDDEALVQTFGTVAFHNGGNLNLSVTTAINGGVHDVNFVQAFSSRYVFDLVGATGAPFIYGDGDTSRISVTFGGCFEFVLGEYAYEVGDSWEILDVSTLGGGPLFTSNFSVEGFSEQGAGVWLSGDGVYEFREATGVLSVVAVPEPGTWALLAGGSVGIGWLRARRRL